MIWSETIAAAELTPETLTASIAALLEISCEDNWPGEVSPGVRVVLGGV